MKEIRTLPLVLLLLLLSQTAGRAQPTDRRPQNVDELKDAILEVLRETRTPGASVALLAPGRPDWVAGLGKADISKDREATPDTLFRAGSISKSFVSLAVLKLREQGRLDLRDRLRDLAPEVEFVNPWEGTDPVLLVHLLEHTAGFDDISLSEYAHNEPVPVPLGEALQDYPAARTCRWRQGTHYSYSNAGPAVAAYVVEKVSGENFEEYVRKNLFEPLEMSTASFLPTKGVRERLARGYAGSSPVEAPYWHILTRPSGALNVSARELASLVGLLINRGTFRDQVLFQAESITRMETPTTTLAAREGIQVGYGLGNFTSSHRGFLFHGHAGGIDSFMASYGYLPLERLGYVFMINKSETQAFERIEALLRNYLIRDLPRPQAPISEVPPARLHPLARYYEPITPRQETVRFLDRILGVIRVQADGAKLTVHPLFGEPSNLLPVTDRRFRGEEDPLASVVFLADRDLIVQGYSRALNGNFRSVPAIRVALERVLWVLILLTMLSSLVYALTWLPRKLLGSMPDQDLGVRLLPFLGVLTLVGASLIVAVSLSSLDLIRRFGNLTPWSFSFFLLTWLFAVLSVAGFVKVFRDRKKVARPNVLLHSMIVSIANCIVTGYLLYWGIIGIRTWS